MHEIKTLLKPKIIVVQVYSVRRNWFRTKYLDQSRFILAHPMVRVQKRSRIQQQFGVTELSSQPENKNVVFLQSPSSQTSSCQPGPVWTNQTQSSPPPCSLGLWTGFNLFYEMRANGHTTLSRRRRRESKHSDWNPIHPGSRILAFNWALSCCGTARSRTEADVELQRAENYKTTSWRMEQVVQENDKRQKRWVGTGWIFLPFTVNALQFMFSSNTLKNVPTGMDWCMVCSLTGKMLYFWVLTGWSSQKLSGVD